MASWLVDSSPDRAVRVRALALAAHFTSLVVISGSQHLIVFVFITLCNLKFNLMQVQIKLLLLLAGDIALCCALSQCLSPPNING